MPVSDQAGIHFLKHGRGSMRMQGSELQGACRWIYVYIVATIRDIENECICALCVCMVLP